MHKGKVRKVENIQLCPIDSVHLPRDQRMRLETIKEVHQKLAALNERNTRAFGPFIRMLDEELQQGPPEEPEDR
jgi:two-component sensor histidine kinase